MLNLDMSTVKKATFLANGVIIPVTNFSSCSADLAASVPKEAARPTQVMWRDGEQYGVITGTTIRSGAIRHPAVHVIREALIEITGNNTPYSLDEYLMNAIGGSKGEEKNSRYTLEDFEYYRDRNPVLSMFGAGAGGCLNMVGGTLAVMSAYTQKPIRCYVEPGARKDPFKRDIDEMGYLSSEDQGKYDAYDIEVKKTSAFNKAITKLEGEIKKYRAKDDTDKVLELEKDLDELRALEQKNPSKISIERPLPGHKMIPFGTPFDHMMRLTRSTPTELGCLLASLSYFAINRPFLGAHYGNMNGLISGKWDISVAGNGYDAPELLGNIELIPDHKLVINGDSLNQALDIFNTKLRGGYFDMSIPVRDKFKTVV